MTGLVGKFRPSIPLSQVRLVISEANISIFNVNGCAKFCLNNYFSTGRARKRGNMGL